MLNEKTDVFCIYRNSKTGKEEVCILKSKAIKCLMKDGMTEDEAEEYYGFNIEGAMGSGQYSCIDDTVDPDVILRLAENKEIYDPSMHDNEERVHPCG